MKTTTQKLTDSIHAVLASYNSNLSHATLLVGEDTRMNIAAAESLAEPLNSTYPNTHFSTDTKETITIAHIHELQEKMKHKRAANETIGVVLSNFERATLEAQNTFLKLLEEPSEEVYFLLTTSQPNSILDTIRSRTQTLQLPKTSLNDALQIFANENIDEVKRAFLATGGNTAQMGEYLHDENSLHKAAIAEAKGIISAPIDERLARIGSLNKREDAIRLCEALLHVYRHVLASKAQNAQPVKPVAEAIDHCIQAIEAIEQNGNTRLHLNLLFTSI